MKTLLLTFAVTFTALPCIAQQNSSSTQPGPLSAELEALHAKAEPAQQADFDRWLDHSLALCEEDANFRQTYTALLQSAADLAKLKAGGLGSRHPQIVALEATVRGQRKQLTSLAAQRRERLRKELINGVKATEAAQAARSSGHAGGDEYQKAKKDYEAALERLRNAQEKAAKEPLPTPVPHEAAEPGMDKEKK